MEAYVLVQTAVGRAVAVAEALGRLDGVVRAESVTGPYDVVVRVEVPTVDELGPLVAEQIAAVAGIARTVTCTVMPR
jgi:DNA-binding Lrp family transcriptional regulator